ncbi:hypothetical protein HPB51_029327 [Rhipicephalus microplus]|uniref:SET domain-containing protein n=1 Tax=Rhipicephalus microplus TaxID=6941 RepID=A0A9J6CUV4_RHIMP|nr:hypothetical protein HPB51_029327 [Rhipicephalus microplus]
MRRARCPGDDCDFFSPGQAVKQMVAAFGRRRYKPRLLLFADRAAVCVSRFVCLLADAVEARAVWPPDVAAALASVPSDVSADVRCKRRPKSKAVYLSRANGLHRDEDKNFRTQLPLSPASFRKAEEELEELAESLQLPSEVLALREGSEPSPELTVYARVMLRGGTLFGPYAAHLVKDPGQSVSATHITIQSKEGSATYLKLKEAAGSWLKTLRLVQDKESANVNLSLEGDEVWCNLTHDIAADTELLAHFTTSPQNKRVLPSTESAVDADALADDIDVVVDDTDNVESTSSAAEELKNGVGSPLKTVSSSPVPTPCNGPDALMAADDESKALDGTENSSAHAEKAESPK